MTKALRTRRLIWLGICGAAMLLPVASHAAGARVTDPATGCATSNPYPEGNESIRWNGACQDGLLSGFGILVWYRGGVETERNEGMFWGGELHGPASTSYPDGTRILGTYNIGQRNGQFMTFRPDGSHVVSEFAGGRMISEHAVAAPQSYSSNSPQTQLRAAARAFEPDPLFQTIIISSAGVSNGVTAALRPVQMAYAGQPDVQPRYTASRDSGYLGTNYASKAATHTLVPYLPPSQPLRTAAASPVAAQAYVQSPEQRFVAAMAAERAGRLDEAANTYSDLATQYPHSDSARLARDRLAMLPAGAALAGRANAPITPSNTAAQPGKFVCTLPDLFSRSSKWCGVVREENQAFMSVEIKRVHPNGIFNIGFTRTPCTGNTFITNLSRGNRVTVPKNCMGPSW